MQDITDVDAYVHLLKSSSSLALCDLTMKNFVVQDFNTDNKQLKVAIIWTMNPLQHEQGAIACIYYYMHGMHPGLVSACTLYTEPSIQVSIKMW